MKQLVLIFLSFCIALNTFSANKSATIKKVWIEHGVTIHNKKAMKVHCNFSVQGMKGLKGSMGIWLKKSNGQWHKVNGNATSTSSTPHFSYTFTPGYDDTRYDDYWYAPYVADLNLDEGRNEYEVIVTIHDNQGNVLATSAGHNIIATVSAKKNSPTPNNGSDAVKTWREELGYGGFVICNQYPSGMIQRIRYRSCPNCHASGNCGNCYGSGRCGICNGQGGIVTAGYGTYIPCMACGQSGRCSLCKGSGKCFCTTMANNPYPGYVIGSTSTIMPDGTTHRETADYNNYDSQSKSKTSTTRSSSTCPDCGGTRLWHKGTSPEYAQPRSELVGYYNSTGNKCPHCGYHTKHWHSKCITCKPNL